MLFCLAAVLSAGCQPQYPKTYVTPHGETAAETTDEPMGAGTESSDPDKNPIAASGQLATDPDASTPNPRDLDPDASGLIAADLAATMADEKLSEIDELAREPKVRLPQAGAEDRSARFVQLLESGKTLYSQWRLDEAISHLNEAASLNPGDFQPYVLLGMAHMRKREYSKSIAAYTMAVQFSQASDVLYTYRGHAYLHGGEFKKAVADFSAALELNLENEQAWLGRATAQLNQRQFPRAISDATEVLKLSASEPQAYFVRALAKLAVGQRESARADYQEAIRHGLDKASADSAKHYFVDASAPK